MNQLQVPVVIDNGSGQCKAGFAGESEPSAVFSSAVGSPRISRAARGLVSREWLAGEEALRHRHSLRVRYPIEGGRVMWWEGMEALWEHAFTRCLGIDVREHPVLLTEPPLNLRANREKMAQVMFEVFECPAVFVGMQALLSLYATGRTTGLVLDVGECATHAVPIAHGYAVPHGITRLDVGGRHVTEHLMKRLTERGYAFTTTAERDVVSRIKECVSYVALDFDAEMMHSSAQCAAQYELPDGQQITIGKERFCCNEALFQPSLAGIRGEGVHVTCSEAISKCELGEFVSPPHLYRNVVLAGGSTAADGFAARMERELAALAPCTHVEVVAVPERRFAAWVGGSVLASLPTFQDMWHCKEDYDERGSGIVNRTVSFE